MYNSASCLTIQGGNVIGFYLNKMTSGVNTPIITQTNNAINMSMASGVTIVGTDVVEGVIVTVE
jgi:hypothetical protein